jgi:curved DNA-binding protein CbpA
MKWKEIRLSYLSHVAELAKLDPYALLGISPNTSDEGVTAAYRHKVKAYHPDVSDPFLKRHNEEVSKLLNAAYDKILHERGHGA